MITDFNATNENWRNAKQDTRNRIQQRFWLDANKPDEFQLIKDLHHFKSQRKFAQTIRNALRLFFALLLGDTSVLMALFPAVVDSLRQDLIAQNAALQATIAAQEQRIADLEADSIEVRQFIQIGNELQAIKALLSSQQPQFESVPVAASQQPQNGANSSAMQPIGVSAGNGGIKPITGLKPLAAPRFDEDSDLLEVKPATRPAGGTSAAQNFINSMMALQQN